MWCVMIMFFFLSFFCNDLFYPELKWWLALFICSVSVHLRLARPTRVVEAPDGISAPGACHPGAVYGNSSLGLLHPFYPGISFPSAWEILPAPTSPQSTVLYLLFLEIHLLPRFDYFLIRYMISSLPAWMIQLERPHVLGRSFLPERCSDH